MPAQPKKKKDDITEKCPDCKGEGVTEGYYTLGRVTCTTCDGHGVVPVGEADQMRAKAATDASGD